MTSAAEKVLLKVPGSRTVMAHLPGLGQVTDSLFGEDVDAKHEQEGLHGVQSEYELQMSQLPYTGTFDDFNDRVVQVSRFAFHCRALVYCIVEPLCRY